MSSRPITRRAVLQGGAVALSLPWLETLAPRKADAAAAPLRRYISMYYPNGTTPNFWFPTAPGTGNAWSISPILESRSRPSRPTCWSWATSATIRRWA